MDLPASASLQSSSSPILVTPGAVLPHNDIESNQLASQASHLTLATPTSGSNRLGHAASSAIVSEESVSGAFRRRRRACSACCRVSDAAPPMQHARQLALPIESLLPSSATALDLGADAQTSLRESHEDTREEATKGDPGPAGCEEYERYQTQYLDVGDTRSTTLIPACSRGCRWTGRSEPRLAFADFPNEVLLHILSYLDVCDLLATSRVSAVSLLLLCGNFGANFARFFAPKFVVAATPRRHM